MSTPPSKTPLGFRSLKNRISKHENIFSPGGLSSKTRALLQQLERVYTPSKEARRMSVLKSGTAERWAVNTTFSPATSGVPPLKALRNGPSRLQMLSTKYYSIKSRLPYWKDIYRPTMKERDDATKNKTENPALVPDLDGSKLCAMFEVPSPKKKPEPIQQSRSSILKGPDGVSRNFFNTADLDELDDVNTLPLPTAIPLPIVPIPQKGFLGDLAFSFELPKCRTGNEVEKKKHEISSSETTDDSEECSSDEEEDMSLGSVEAIPARTQEKAVVESVDAASSPISVSLKDASVQMEKAVADMNTSIEKPCDELVTKVVEADKKEEAPREVSSTWSCPTCFVSNTAESCICCGTQKDGSSASASAATIKLVSNFPPVQSSSSFKFGLGSSSTNAEPPQAASPDLVQSMFGVSAPSDEQPVAVQPSFGFPATVPAAPTGSAFGAVASSGSGSFKFGFGSAPTEPPKVVVSESRSLVKPMFGSIMGTAEPQHAPGVAPPESLPMFGMSTAFAAPNTIQTSFGFPTAALPAAPAAPLSSAGFTFPSTAAAAPSDSGFIFGQPSLFGQTNSTSAISTSAFTNPTTNGSSAQAGFNFGAAMAPTSSAHPFVFGSSAASPSSPFGQTSAPSTDFAGVFAYKPNPAGSAAAVRKIAHARRRMVRK